MTQYNYVFKLYIYGTTQKSERAIANLKRLCEKEFSGVYRIDIVDVMENPEEAENGRILATPTLVKTSPAPESRVIGDLSDDERVLQGLALFAGRAGYPTGGLK